MKRDHDGMTIKEMTEWPWNDQALKTEIGMNLYN
jgi:hypothetical protein